MRNLICVLLLCPLTAFAHTHEPTNLSVAKKSVKAYHDSGQYSKDQATVMHAATAYLSQRIKENVRSEHPKKLAVVLDIDETTLSNYKRMAEMDFGGKEMIYEQWQNTGNEPAVKPTLTFYRFAKQHDVAIFFVSAREPAVLKETLKNLHAEGFTGFQAIYIHPEHFKGHSAIPFKSHIRKKIEAKGYDIVASIGDQDSDLKGGYADKTFKLPNPFYYLP